jgi:uncharacterized protein (TIGR02284 family)
MSDEVMTEDIISVLNDLIETSKDGEYGFRTCAEHANSVELRATFLQRADDCRNAAEELQAHVQLLGGKPETGGSAMGAVHRGWVAVRSKLSSYDDLAILEECERGEDTALMRYRAALEHSLPEPLHGLVNRQYAGAKRNHDQIRLLRNRLREG